MASGMMNAVDLCQQVMDGVPTGVAVMTLVDSDGVPHGMTISSLTTVSADPPSVLMCIGGAASSRPFPVEGQRFCANLLASDQALQSADFAYGAEDPFEVHDWTPADDGTPILADTAAHLLYDVERVVEHHGVGVVLARRGWGSAGQGRDPGLPQQDLLRRIGARRRRGDRKLVSGL